MDNLTHTMVGVVLSRAGLNRLAPRATLTAVLAVNIPDIDVIFAPWGSLTYLKYHRGLTHALVFLPVMAALVTLIVRLIFARSSKKPPWAGTYAVALAAVASHPLLDFTNSYGVRPWLPFSAAWYSWDIVHVVDLWLWAMLFVCVAIPVLGRLISGEIGAKAGSGRGMAVLALLLIAGWWGARDVLHRRALAMLDSRLYGFESEQSPPIRIAAFPTFANPFSWHGFVETEKFYQLIPMDVTRPLDPSAGQVYFKPAPGPALDAALRTRSAQEFSDFARYRATTVDKDEDKYRVTLTDLRFHGQRPDAFSCVIELDQTLRVLRERFHF